MIGHISEPSVPEVGGTTDSVPEIVLFGEDILSRVRELSQAVDQRVHQAIQQQQPTPAQG
jgi:hypothetical protein